VVVTVPEVSRAVTRTQLIDPPATAVVLEVVVPEYVVGSSIHVEGTEEPTPQATLILAGTLVEGSVQDAVAMYPVVYEMLIATPVTPFGAL
jgi:hypothetical protein